MVCNLRNDELMHDENDLICFKDSVEDWHRLKMLAYEIQCLGNFQLGLLLLCLPAPEEQCDQSFPSFHLIVSCTAV